jgi:hypothetical protein
VSPGLQNVLKNKFIWKQGWVYLSLVTSIRETNTSSAVSTGGLKRKQLQGK